MTFKIKKIQLHNKKELLENRRALRKNLTPAEVTILQKKIDARLAALQQLIRDVGLQALDENAEWLILHRSRPLEPVMAG